MVSGITSGSGSDELLKLMKQMMQQKMKAADTDGTDGLSLDELSSIDTSDDQGGAGFLKSLTENFDSIDTDKNGQLTSDEIEASKPKQQMGPPPGLEFLTSGDTDGDSALSKDELSAIESGDDSSASKLASAIQENFDILDTNQDGKVSQEELDAVLKKGQGDGPPPPPKADETTTTGDNSNNASTTSGEQSSSGVSLSSLLDAFKSYLESSFDAYKSDDLASAVDFIA